MDMMVAPVYNLVQKDQDLVLSYRLLYLLLLILVFKFLKLST